MRNHACATRGRHGRTCMGLLVSSDLMWACFGSQAEPRVFFPLIAIFLVGGGACGDVGEGEHFPAFRACSGSGGSAAGRQSRSSTYPRAFLVNLPRRAIAEALVLALRVVKVQPGANAGLG